MPLCDAPRRSDKPGNVRLWLSACARMRQNDGPIRLLVSFPPGGASDLVARTLGQPLGARLGQPVVVENRPGSNGNLAGELAAHATPDGYTLLLGPSSLFAINPHLYAKMAIDPLKDLLPVASLVSNELILAANPALPSVTDFRGFIALARDARPPLFYASIGNGSEHHLAMELLKQQAGIDLVHVPYRGGGPACCPTCRPLPTSIPVTKSRSGRACSRPSARRRRSWRGCARRRMRFSRSRTSWRSSPPPAPAIPTSPRLRSSRRTRATAS